MRPDVESERAVDMFKKELNSEVRLFPSNHGFELKGSVLSEKENALDFSLADYLQLIDWTGRALRQDKRGAIPAAALPILRRLGLSPERWLKFIQTMETRFSQAVGGISAVSRENGFILVARSGFDKVKSIEFVSFKDVLSSC